MTGLCGYPAVFMKAVFASVAGWETLTMLMESLRNGRWTASAPARARFVPRVFSHTYEYNGNAVLVAAEREREAG